MIRTLFLRRLGFVTLLGAALLPAPLWAGDGVSATAVEVQPHLVFVHGIFRSGKSFRKFAKLAKAEGWVAHCPTLSQGDGKVPCGELADEIADYIESEVPREAPVHLVGYSLGGIVLKQVVMDGRLGDQVVSLTTLGAPHRGTAWAYGLPRVGCKELRPNSDLLAAQDAHDFGDLPVLSVWTPFDLMIFPAGRAKWEGQENMRSYALAHPLLIRSRGVFGRIAEHVSAASEG